MLHLRGWGVSVETWPAPPKLSYAPGRDSEFIPSQAIYNNSESVWLAFIDLYRVWEDSIVAKKPNTKSGGGINRSDACMYIKRRMLNEAEAKTWPVK